MGRRAALCLLLALTLSACRSEPEEAAAPPPPVPAPVVAERVPPMPPPASLADVEPDAYCQVVGWQYERRNGIWVPNGYEDNPVDRTARLGEDPELDQALARAGREPVFRLGPTVRVHVGREVVEVVNDDLTDQYAGVVCQPRGKVRLPRNLGPMGTSLEEQLRRDNRTEWGKVKAEFVVERDGRVGKLIDTRRLTPEYEELLLEDLREVQFQPGTLDGKPVAVIHKVELVY